MLNGQCASSDWLSQHFHESTICIVFDKYHMISVLSQSLFEVFSNQEVSTIGKLDIHNRTNKNVFENVEEIDMHVFAG